MSKVTVKCNALGGGHVSLIDDSGGEIAKAGYVKTCPYPGCDRIGWKMTTHTEDDMQHLDDPSEICDKCGQAINQSVGFMGKLEAVKDPPGQEETT